MPDSGRRPTLTDLLAAAREALSGAEIDRVLGEFRTWLEALIENEPPSAPDEPAIDLAALVGAFTALRHDVNLQTKAARAQAEQAADALDLLHNVVDRLEDEPPPENSNSDALLVSLVEAADALTRASQGIERALASKSLPTGWRRWFANDDRVGAMKATLAAAGEGLALAAQRLERALEKHGLDAIESTGQQFDPESMEAIEVVTGSGLPPEVVVEEVRRGYLRNGAMFRTALVKVSRDAQRSESPEKVQ